MRLIDADAFIKYLGLDAENAREENLGNIVTLEDFDRQPTAYNVDKVVEQLKELKLKEYDDADEEPNLTDVDNIYEEGVSQGKYIAYGKSIEIVKAGGTHE